jgi:hypothetical protein
MNEAQPGPERDAADGLRDVLAEIDRELAQVELADIVRLRKPYGLQIDRQKGPFRFGIVAEILTVLPDGRTRNVSLYLYDPERKEIFLGPNSIPEFVRQVEEGLQPVALLPPVGFDLGPALGTGDHGAKGEGDDVEQAMQPRVLGARVVKIGEMVRQGDGGRGSGGHAILREEALPRFPESILRCSLVRGQGARQ